MSEDKHEVFSYHTFVLPFVWNVDGINKKSIATFYKCFEDNPNWICTDIDDESRINSTCDIMNDDDAYQLFAEYQYFNPAARRAIYGFGSEIVRNYCFDPSKVRNRGKYIIEKGTEKYTLLLNGIRLKIYNTGVALFILECENPRGADYKHQNNMDAVKNINDYGRRISLPFIPRKDLDNGKYFSICADKLSLDIPEIGTFESENLKFAHTIQNKKDIFEKVCLTHICDFVKKILEFGSKYSFSTNSKKAGSNANTFYIYPALDDRMFVISVVNDDDCARHYTESFSKDYYRYERDDELSKDLYELVFTDPANNCTCPDGRMRYELLDKHIYRRWISFSSIYGVANQSFVCVTNFEPTINSVLTQYCQMIYLCLAQRASIINFQREVTILSQSIEKQGKSIKTSTIAKVLDLQERFVAFQNQLSFSEVSSQEQAIELYGMLTDSFYIENERETLGAQLESLYSTANTNLDFSLNKGGAVLAVAAILLSLVSFIADLIPFTKYILCMEDGSLPFGKFAAVFGIYVLIIAVIILCILRIYRRNR